MASATVDCQDLQGIAIRLSGTVQGVGLRPAVWRLARACGIRGAVWNDSGGVLIHAWGDASALAAFRVRIRAETPPLAQIEALVSRPLSGAPPAGFAIMPSRAGTARTAITPDAATCPDCLAEIFDPADRRYRYPFTSCTHCGPRLSIVSAIPYDRDHTSMAAFELCPACRAEYEDPANRRFHAQANACPDCGPRLWLEDGAGRSFMLPGAQDAIDAACGLIAAGHILAIKGLGGVQLACDAGNPQAVARLRVRKQRPHKAFALMARDLAMIRDYAQLSVGERRLLQEPAAPIVLLAAQGRALAAGIAPDTERLGFMLPCTPLHHLLMQDMQRPIVLTSGNRNDAPPCLDNDAARSQLAGIADYFLLHDRPILNRLDDSVVQLAVGRPRLLRRARGYAPAPLALPPGFNGLPSVIAMGSGLKNTFCFLCDGQTLLSPHLGDLDEATTFTDYQRHLALYRRLYGQEAAIIAVDRHPGYASTRLGRMLAGETSARLLEVQHHHAHIAACMAEHGLPAGTAPVLGVALDGLGLGDDGALWGGEFLLVDYCRYEHLAGFQPVSLPGGDLAAREPWRNTYAHLREGLIWTEVQRRYPDLAIVRFLAGQPLRTLDVMMARGLNAPPASSCGRLFDAVAAALGLCTASVSFEGQAAMALEMLARPLFPALAAQAYPHEQHAQEGRIVIGWRTLWLQLLDDLQAGITPGVIAARFHQGVVQAVTATALQLAERQGVSTVVLGGGAFQNRLLLAGVSEVLAAQGLRVLAPARLPANDGGLSLGQAVVAAARELSARAQQGH